MGLFDVFKKKGTMDHMAGKVQAEAPHGVPAGIDAASGALAAPVSGRVIAMSDIPDPVFSSEVLGKGCAIWPESTVAYAPCSGTVSVVMGHAVGLVADDGVEVLVHVGIDTVDMNGEGFSGYVSTGARVEAGEPLLAFDRKAIAAAGHPDCVVLAVSNSAEYGSVKLIPTAGDTVEAGAPLLEITK